MGLMAIGTAPEAAALKPEAPKHYELSLSLMLDGRRYEVEHHLVCEHRRQFTAAFGWRLNWQTHQEIVAKRFPDGSTFLFRPPRGICLSEEIQVVPNIVVILDEGKLPESLALYDARLDMQTKTVKSAVVVKGMARRNQAPSTLAQMSERERETAKWLTDHLDRYVSRQVTVIAESAWGSDATLRSVLPSLQSTTKASDFDPASARGLRRFKSNTFPTLPNPAGERTDNLVRYYAPVPFQGDLLVDDRTPIWNTRTFSYEQGPRPSRLCYRAECISIDDERSEEIFFPATRELVRLSKRTLKLSF